jgi:type IV secretory pathway VirB2 component (pilin)
VARHRRSLEGNVGRLILLVGVSVVATLFLIAVVSGGVVRELGWLLTIAVALGAAGYLAFRSPEPPQS